MAAMGRIKKHAIVKFCRDKGELLQKYKNEKQKQDSVSHELALRARFHEHSLFAKYLHTFVSDFQNKCHLKCFNCLSILKNRYNPMKNRYIRL